MHEVTSVRPAAPTFGNGNAAPLTYAQTSVRIDNAESQVGSAGGRAMHELTSVRPVAPTFSTGTAAPLTYAQTGVQIDNAESQVGSAGGSSSTLASCS
jgi:hypothetical protein